MRANIIAKAYSDYSIPGNRIKSTAAAARRLLQSLSMATFLTCQSVCAGRTLSNQLQDEFPKKGAELLESLIREAIASRGVCKVGFSGGSTPKDVYKSLASSSSIDWSKVIAFLVDERCIPASQADSNQHLLSQAGLLSLPARWILPKTELSPIECAKVCLPSVSA